MREIEKKYVIKRDGELVEYDIKKIINAIEGANSSTGNIISDDEIMNIALQVNILLKNNKIPKVEDIQDLVEQQLMDRKFFKAAKAYILYRDLHNKRRNAAVKLMEGYNDLLFTSAKDMDLKRDNANINADSSMGIMLKLGTEGAKSYVDNYALPLEVAEADRENWIHIHDKDFSLITFNCCQIDLAKLLKGGFNTGHGFLREPNSIRAAASLAAIAIQSNQNDMFKLNQSY